MHVYILYNERIVMKKNRMIQKFFFRREYKKKNLCPALFKNSQLYKHLINYYLLKFVLIKKKILI